MRFVMYVSMPVERFNEAVRDGSAGQKMGRILDELRPEAAYFTSKDGKRGGVIVVNMESASEIPKYAEPWFLNFDAEVDFQPCMTPEDLHEAGLDVLGKKWK